MITCASCGVAGQPGTARFCHACGSALAPPRCPACEAEVVVGARFCSSCGASLGESPVPSGPTADGPVASRRVTSVLFGDLVGFTGLSESRDQEDVRELLSRYFEECRQIIGRYGGTVEKFIGDAVMAVWGVPTAHEDDAERAVRAGLELVNRVAALGGDVGVPDLAMRVGIVTGEVAVTIGAQQQGMVAGDAVNTAARVQSAASPGQVWVDETTRLLTSSAISYVDVGSHPLKGKAEPVPLWSVRAVFAGIGGGQRADGLEAPLRGRDRELRMVKEMFHGVEESGRPGLLVVAGEPGVGKTRLGWEFEKYTDGLRTGVFWHSGRCLSYGEGVAFYALAEAIRGRLLALRPPGPDGTVAADSDEDQARLLSLGLDVLVADPDERAWLEPRVAALLGIGGVGTFKREDLFNAWATLLRRIGRDQEPVVLVIDDGQYADDGLVAFLEHLMAVAAFPIFVLLLSRPSLLDDRPGLAANRRVSVVHLEPLPEADMGDLLDGLVAGLPPAVRTGLVERAEGIPLYAVETVRSLIDRDLVLPRAGQYVLADRDRLDLDTIAAPASLQALIAARLDALGPTERRVLDRASVIGSAFTREQIARLCPDVEDLGATLAGLVRLQLLRQESDRLSAERGQYQFVQSGVRQVAYGTLARRDRKAAHLAVVAMLEEGDNSAGEQSPIIAQHLVDALDAVPGAEDAATLGAAAVEHLRRAAVRARSLGAPAESAGHLQAALARCSDPGTSAAIETDLALALTSSGDHEGALEHARSARDHFDAVGDPLGAGRAVVAICRALIYGRGSMEEANTLASERIAALHGVEGAAAVEMGLAEQRVAALLRTGVETREAAEEHARLADQVGDDSDVADSYISLALHYMTAGPRSLGRVLLESAAQRARSAHDPHLLARALTNLNADWGQDDAERAAEFGREAVSTALATGDRRWVSAASLNLGLVLCLAGRFDEALDTLDHEWMEPVDQVFVEVARCRIADVRGEAYTPDVDATASHDDLAARAFLTVVVARERLASGRSATGLLVEAADLLYQQGGIYDDFALLWQYATDLAWGAGDREALDGLFDVAARDTLNKPPVGLRAQQARMRGLTAIEDGSAAEVVERHLRTAVSEARAWRSVPTTACGLADLGVWLARTGRTEEAAEPLAEARAAFGQLGAATWTRSLDDRLAGVTA